MCWAALAAIVTASLARAQSYPYELSQGADFEWGCFGNCGCGAAHYGMGLDNDFTPEDNVFDASGVRVVADGESAPLLEGAEIDYRDSLMGRGFTIKNPNAGGGCGCGH